jgi:hypothetical protein
VLCTERGLHARNVPVGPGYLRLFRFLTGEQPANRSRQETERSSAAKALLPQPGGFEGFGPLLERRDAGFSHLVVLLDAAAADADCPDDLVAVL